ncbi:MAG TPA: hypothetical protein VN224_02185 [Xanthomonadales bacterium]|nr:hypothetical protein [Xanthomonadales bacterium]
MLYSPPRVATAAASVSILLGTILLAGCASGSNATVTHNPPLSTFGGKSTARSAVQSAILIADTSNGNAVPGGPTPAGIARSVLAMMRGRHVSLATGACVNGKKSSQAVQPDGTRTTTTDYFYDALCATLEEDEVVNVDTSSAATTTGTGSITTYDRTGAVTSFHKLALASTNDPTAQTVNVTDTASATAGGTVLASSGASCTGAPNSPTMSCSAAMYGTAGTATFGQALFDSATAGTGGAKNVVTVNITFYGAGITGINLSSAGWGVLGAAGFNSATGTYSYSTTGTTGSGTLSLTDSLYTYTVSGNLTATGLAVTIVRNTDPIATATVDQAGNGSITYADGTTDVIWGNVVGV